MSTSLDNFPSPPMDASISAPQQHGGADPNAQYNPNMDFPAQSQTPALDSETVQELVRGLQEANSSGATSIPVRDLPQNTTELQQDAQAQPNYVPPPSNRRVRFEEEDNYDQITEKNADINRRSNSYNSIYDELQTPLLLAVLFFLFQLPIVRLALYKYLPRLHDSGGSQLNLLGICLCSVLFGFGYTFILKTMGYISSF